MSKIKIYQKHSITYFYASIFFNKDKIVPMLEASDKILYSLSNKLEVFPKHFDFLILSKQIIGKLIEKSESFKQVLNFLFFMEKKSKSICRSFSGSKEQ